MIPLGPKAAAPVAAAPAPAAPSCADLDDDGDGVNNCDDKCPNSQPGQAIGPDGCPVPVSIDLKGVNFDFNKATLRPDAVAILNEASQILTRYPDLRVEVAGHTDLCGTEAYKLQAVREVCQDRVRLPGQTRVLPPRVWWARSVTARAVRWSRPRRPCRPARARRTAVPS